MSATKIRQSLENLTSFLESLEEALKGPEEVRAFRDSTILSFTFVYELSWKTLRRFLIHAKIPPNDLGTPGDVMRKAFQAYWITDDQLWLAMADHRNLLVHTYNEGLAKEVYDRIKEDYVPEFRRLHKFLSRRFSELVG
jgi:nucleotidyltransferase substrate binding protein (TIGR01987 family)